MRRFFRIFGIVVVSSLIVLILALAAMYGVYRNSFYPGVRVGGVALAQTSRQQGAAAVQLQQASLLKHAVAVLLPDASVTALASEVGLSLQSSAPLDSAWQFGHSASLTTWLKDLATVAGGGQAFPFAYSMDPAMVDTFIATVVQPKLHAPVSAKIVVTGDVVTVQDATSGERLDPVVLRNALIKAIPANLDEPSTTVRAVVTPSVPSVTKETLAPLAATLSSLGDQRVLLTGAPQTVRPSRADILAWFSLVQDDRGGVSINVDQPAVQRYLVSVAGTGVDQVASLKSLTDTLTASLTDATALSKTIALKQKVVEAPVVAADFTPGRYPGKYIEVSLKNQRLYRINGDTLEKTYVVSTGKWSTPTPKGTFTVGYKSPRAYSATFGLYMPNWMNLLGTPDGSDTALPVGSYGLHELPEWPNGYKEGQSHLGTPVSHGCVRLGVGDAAEMYAWTDEGTPVIIH